MSGSSDRAAVSGSSDQRTATAAVEQGALVAPPAPPVVAERFADRTELLQRYAGLLAGPGAVRGLIGPREVPRLWGRHLLNCVALGELLPMGARVVDIGSGAGLPGIAIACARPDLRVDLVESMLRRTDFLTEVVAELGLADRVRVIRGRAEEKDVVRSVGAARFVTARAVAPLDKLARWAYPLLARDGSLLAMKGESAEAELDEHRALLSRTRWRIHRVVECGSGLVTPLTRVVQLSRR